ncbi:MAG: serine hydrolase, partial [Rudanella sp.]|nr:serine hydrolase [Rudanella sp.]
MKTFLSFASSLALTASLLVVTSGCNRFENQIQPESTPSGEARVGGFDLSNGGFDPALFASKIEAQLTGKVTGYGYRIMINGQPYTKAAGGKGYARHLIDAPARVYTPVVRQDIGGCTKFMTAVVVLKMLKRYDVPLEETVWTYLPTYFKPSTDFKKVTFRDLLAHTSGVVDRPKSAEYTIEDVQDSVEDGIFDQGEGSGGIGNGQKPYGQYYYQHMNYMLLRHALVYLVAKKDPNYIRMDFLLLKESRTDKSGLYDLIRHQFSFLLQQEVLKPAGWNQNQYESVGDHPSDNGPNVLYYPVVNPAQPGSTGNGWSQVGTNFMNISADELAGLM